VRELKKCWRCFREKWTLDRRQPAEFLTRAASLALKKVPHRGVRKMAPSSPLRERLGERRRLFEALEDFGGDDG
jgi:hypothetical protein